MKISCVENLKFNTGASVLFGLDELKCPSNFRRYCLCGPVEYEVYTDSGILRVRTESNFIFDGRSGPRIIDLYAPNLGSLEERVAWHMHDCLGYAQSLDFKATNLILKYFLRDICGYRKTKAELIRLAVSISNSWYGFPKHGDEWFCNVGKILTEWAPKS